MFSIGYADFLVRDLLPVQLLLYIGLSYFALARHEKNLRLITASVKEINLEWLRYFLLILALVLLFWINDALVGMSFMLKVMPVAYAISAFFWRIFRSDSEPFSLLTKKSCRTFQSFLKHHKMTIQKNRRVWKK
ncbi:hypothetical protein H9W95_15655 [Flavobacterium lindanitolerans]|nr:hypothetical protein [Flavobacterium lindanitolerans]